MNLEKREIFFSSENEIENESLNGEEIERVIAARFFSLLSFASNIQRFCIGAIFKRVSTFSKFVKAFDLTMAKMERFRVQTNRMKI